MNVDLMTGEQFEVYILNIFKKLGYSGHLTPRTGDYGADLVLYKNGQITIVQAKRYSGSVGIKSIQEIFAAKNYYNASNCIVVTNNYFTKNAINLANINRVGLIDRTELIKIQNKIIFSSKKAMIKSKFKKIINKLLRSKSKEIEKPNNDYHNQLSQYNINLNNSIEHDELFIEAANLVIQNQFVSESFLQRKLRIGFNRASHIIEQLEKEKIVSPRVNYSRKVLISNNKFQE